MLDVLEILLIIFCNKVDGKTVVAEATRAANAVKVRFRVLEMDK